MAVLVTLFVCFVIGGCIYQIVASDEPIKIKFKPAPPSQSSFFDAVAFLDINARQMYGLPIDITKNERPNEEI